MPPQHLIGPIPRLRLRLRLQRLTALALLLLVRSVCAAPAADLAFEVVTRYPHDSHAFTQGLEINGDSLFESSGLYEKSFIAHYPLPGQLGPTVKRSLDASVFGEGLTVWGKRIFVLTWQNQQGFIFDRDSLTPLGEFRYAGEGWGLTHDNEHLIMSDGTSTLRFLNPTTAAVERTVEVKDGGKPVLHLNELEWVDERVLANIWLTNEIVVIDPVTGSVTAHLNLDGLYPAGLRAPGSDVLNGIAFDARDHTLLVTGKLWPTLYRLRLRGPLP